MLSKLKINLTILLLLPFSLGLFAQNGFITKFNTLANEMGTPFIQDTDHNYIGFVSKGDYFSTDYQRYSYYLYKLNQYGDTTLKRNLDKTDTIIRIETITQTCINQIEYLITGELCVGNEPTPPYYEYFLAVDENFNTIWEKYYQLRPPDDIFHYELWQNLLPKKDSGYIFATNIYDLGDEKLVLFELSNQGDSVNYRMYEGDSAGSRLFDLTYNHDSTAYQIYTFYAHQIPFLGEDQCITIDFDLNQTDIFYYPRWFDDDLSAKLLPDGHLITGGLYENYEPPPLRESNMAVYKHDTNFNLVAECHVSNPDIDIRKDGGHRSMDFYYPNSIFVAGTFDWEVAEWPTKPSWIVVGKMDSDLNLLSEQYIGGDAYYQMTGILATDDGGVLISTRRFDYLTQYFETDFYLIKLDSLDLLVSSGEHRNKSVKNALVYPNPASDHLFVRTAIEGAEFSIVDLAGNIIKRQTLTGLISRISLNDIPADTYIWKVSHQSKIYETGKFVKTN